MRGKSCSANPARKAVCACVSPGGQALPASRAPVTSTKSLTAVFRDRKSLLTGWFSPFNRILEGTVLKTRGPTPIAEENRAQLEAFCRLGGEIDVLIARYAADFRMIILSYERAYGRVPSADDLLWIESERCGRDVTQ
jgi:hypothetical protein